MAIVARKKSSGRRHGGAQHSGASRGRALPWALGAALVALAVVVAWWWAAGRRPAADAGGAPRPQSEVKPARETVARPEVAPYQADEPTAAPEAGGAAAHSAAVQNLNGDDRRQQADNSKGDMAARTNHVQTNRPGVVRATAARGAFAVQGERDWQPPAFDNPTESFLGRYAARASNPQMLMPRFPDDADAALREILEADVAIYDDDDPETATNKEFVAKLKREILDAMDEGESAAEILNAMREENNRLVRERRRLQRELNAMLKAGDEDRAREFADTANAWLGENLLPPLETGE